MKKLLKGIGIFIVIVVVGFFGLRSCINSRDSKAAKEAAQETYEWPSTELTKQLPKPDSKNGKIDTDSDDEFEIEIYGTKDEFKLYVNKCKKKGFTVDHDASSNSYDAKNKDGYDLSIEYVEEYGDKPEHYTIELNAPKEETASTETEQTTTTDNSQTTEQTNSYVTYDDFKAAMDSYEQFFDKYVEFMKKYNSSSDNAVSMAKDYAEFMSQYTDTMNKLNNINQDELTTEELNYYIEVHGRILQKLAEVQ